MAFQFVFCERKITEQRKKVIYVWIAGFTKGSVSFQAVSNSDSFLAISAQLWTAKIMWDDPRDS